jgi:glycosyltransferase involved in cell wall biosynthesis
VNAPTVSIILAAYGRPEVLRWAIGSVRAQTWADWELLVVADACPLTAAFMSGDPVAGDPRIRFHNLARNFGDQSGPNNFGARLARGRYLAFLNQDDLWFPDHLQRCLEHLCLSGADIVFPYSGALVGATPDDLAAGKWLGGLTGVPVRGGYDPVTTFAPASSWLLRRDVFEDVGGWRSARECVIAPSQDFMYRAWRRGLKIRSCPELTVLMFSSGGRKASYRTDLSHEQRWWLETMGLDDRARALLWGRLDYHPPQPPVPERARRERAASIGRWLLRMAARLGIEPLTLQYRFRHGYRKGDYINAIRGVRGLGLLPRHADDVRGIRRRNVEQACAYAWGQVLDFSTHGTAGAYQLAGWAFPEGWGAWTEGGQAELLLRLPRPLPEVLTLTLEAVGFITEQCPRQRVVVLIDGTELACLSLTVPEFAPTRLSLGRDRVAGDDVAVIGFRLLDAVSPAETAGVDDHRRLGLGVKNITIDRG